MSPKFARSKSENKNYPGSGLSYVILIKKIGVTVYLVNEGENIINMIMTNFTELSNTKRN